MKVRCRSTWSTATWRRADDCAGGSRRTTSCAPWPCSTAAERTAAPPVAPRPAPSRRSQRGTCSSRGPGRPTSWWLLLEGDIALVRRVGQEETTLGHMATPGQWAGGFRAWDEHGVYMASGRAVTDGRLLSVPADELGSAGTRLVRLRRPSDHRSGGDCAAHRGHGTAT